jgi:hypothetical protein
VIFTVPHITPGRSDRPFGNGEAMSVVAYVAVTVAVFALLGFAQRLVERL